ncbi:hypothetical protein EB118_14520 [bacterium]|nr:hypothetical protein [bacterium]NDG79953.1 hypothetical protein [Synechococcaceae bacterium WB8_1B_057]
MRIRHLLETSPDTFQGSLTPDLIASKIWMCQQLKESKRTKFSTIYILGSWYGNMGYVLKKCGIKFKKIINVDQDQKRVKFSQELYKKLKIPSENKWADVNTVDFMEADQDSLIINTSISDMLKHRWFSSVPIGPLIALQSRNNAEGGHARLVDFDELFPMREVLYVNERQFSDPETDYLRFMKIGVK